MTRTRRVLAVPDLEARLEVALHILVEQGPVVAYYALNDVSVAKIPGLGPAFFTKALYFADPTHLALILDAVLAAAVNQLVPGGPRLRSAGWSTPRYAYYLALLNRVAAAADVPADRIEASLFARARTA